MNRIDILSRLTRHRGGIGSKPEPGAKPGRRATKLKDMKTIATSHIKALQKVRQQLLMRQTMNYTQIIAGQNTIKRIDEAEDLIFKAINKLSEIE